MQEIYDNLFQETISYSDRHMSPRNLYLIRQPGRSLMVDTSFRFERDWEILRGMVDSLGVSYKERADLLHCDLADEESRIQNLRIVGVTKKDTPDVYQAIMEYTGRAYAERGKAQDFPFIPVHPGQTLEYGEYQFDVVSLKGDTFGQCGLHEKRHGFLFCGDQIMTTIVPIVGSQQKDLGLLKCYMESLGDMKHRYADCRILPCHYGPVADVEKEANRIILGYLDKCEIMKGILEEDGGLMTTRDVGVRAYGRSQGPPDYRHFVSCTQIWAKTFSCLEFMYGEGLVERCEREGIIYWKRTEGAG